MREAKQGGPESPGGFQDGPAGPRVLDLCGLVLREDSCVPPSAKGPSSRVTSTGLVQLAPCPPPAMRQGEPPKNPLVIEPGY